MIKFTNIAVVLLLLGSLFSCTKFGKNITVTGRVLNPITGKGHAGIKISLVKKKSLSLPGGFKSVKDVYTSEDGSFELNHLGGASSYFLQSQYLEYNLGWHIDGEYHPDIIKVTKGKKQNVDYHGVPYGNIKVNIHNTSCEGASDQLILERNYKTDPNNTIYQPITIEGCYSAEGVAAKVPMGYYDLKWTVIKPSGTNVFTDEVFVPENGIGEYTINY